MVRRPHWHRRPTGPGIRLRRKLPAREAGISSGRGLPDVVTIFTVALEHHPGAEREAYLTAVCGEDVALGAGRGPARRPRPDRRRARPVRDAGRHGLGRRPDAGRRRHRGIRAGADARPGPDRTRAPCTRWASTPSRPAWPARADQRNPGHGTGPSPPWPGLCPPSTPAAPPSTTGTSWIAATGSATSATTRSAASWAAAAWASSTRPARSASTARWP